MNDFVSFFCSSHHIATIDICDEDDEMTKTEPPINPSEDQSPLPVVSGACTLPHIQTPSTSTSHETSSLAQSLKSIMCGDLRELERLGGTSESVSRLLGVDAQRTIIIFAENVKLLASSPPATNNNPTNNN